MKPLSTVKSRIGLTALLLLPAIVYALTTSRSSGAVLVHEDTLPERVGEWVGKLEPLTDQELNVLHSPAASQRIYHNSATGEVVQILIVQVENTQNAHDPRLCMAGSGHSETSTCEESAPWADGHPDRNQVSHSVFSKDGRDLHMYYWMSTSEGTVANMSTGLKLDGMMRALKGEPTRGIAVRVLGHENASDPSRTTDPESVKALWKQVREQVKFEGLVAGE